MRSLLKRSPLVLEVVPPALRRGQEGLDKRVARVERIHGRVPFDAVNIPEIHEESSKSDLGDRKKPFEPRFAPRELGVLIQDRLGLPVIVNNVVVHRTRDALRDWFLETHEQHGIEGYVLVGGEKPPWEYDGPSVPEANRILKETLPDSVCLGNISIPGRHADDLTEAQRMAEKSAAGTDFFSTQIVYHAEDFTGLLDDLAAAGGSAAATPILLSLCPVKSQHSFAFLRWLGVRVDQPLVDAISGAPDDETGSILDRSIEHLVAMWRTIRDHMHDRGIQTPVGVNLAPVGPIPPAATVDLASQLRELISSE